MGEIAPAAGLEAILRRVRFLGPESFVFAREPTASEPAFPVESLADFLYRRCFARCWESPAMEAPAELEEDLLAARLKGAHPGKDRWSVGWRVEEILEGGRLVARRGEMRRVAAAREYAPTFSDSVAPVTGSGVTLLLAKDSLTLQPGTYCAFGRALPKAEDEAETVRLYWNAPPSALAELYPALIAPLDRLEVPFTLKTMLRLADRDRLDATVLYLPVHSYSRVEEVLARLPRSLWEALGPELPLFTKPLAAGLGAAETPRSGESFGVHRCRLLADALTLCGRAGQDKSAERRAAVERRFAGAGLSLAAPHLNPGSDDRYRPLRQLGGPTP